VASFARSSPPSSIWSSRLHQALAKLVHGLAGIGLEQIAKGRLSLDHIEFLGAGKGVGVIGQLFLERAGLVDFRFNDTSDCNGLIELESVSSLPEKLSLASARRCLWLGRINLSWQIPF
jgi:hypothetical protein